jgi:hypothetical protein
MSNTEDIFLEFSEENNDYSLIIESNKRVVYAYLLEEGKLVGDVWLYNICEIPIVPEWKTNKEMPFANSEEYVLEHDFLLPTSDDFCSGLNRSRLCGGCFCRFLRSPYYEK